MGLDTVELIVKIEDHFMLPIPDQVAEKFVTVRDISDYITGISNADPERKIQMEQEILLIVSDHAGIDIKHLSLDMSIINDLGLD